MLLLDVLVVVLDTGTAVTLFFTCNTDLFSVLSTGREISVGGVRRVLTFPSGRLLAGELDINLFVRLGRRLRLAVPICRWEDAEGHGDSGFKVQIAGFCRRERIFSYNLSQHERKIRKILRLLFLRKQKSKRGEGKGGGRGSEGAGKPL